MSVSWHILVLFDFQLLFMQLSKDMSIVVDGMSFHLAQNLDYLVYEMVFNVTLGAQIPWRNSRRNNMTRCENPLSHSLKKILFFTIVPKQSHFWTWESMVITGIHFLISTMPVILDSTRWQISCTRLAEMYRKLCIKCLSPSMVTEASKLEEGSM